MKKCNTCSFEGSEDLFRKNKNKCLNCHKQYMKNYYETNKERLLKAESERRNKKCEGNKICRICNEEKNCSHFIQNGNTCSNCWKNNMQEYYLNNRDKILNHQHNYLNNNKQIAIDYRIKNKTKLNDNSKLYYQKNKKRINIQKLQYEKNKRDTDNLYNLTYNIRRNINNSLKSKGYKKSSRTEQILGCSYEEFKKYIESKFKDWMTWENKGKYLINQYNIGWDLDHIIPISSATTEEEAIKLNHYTNFQPLCSKFNRDIKKDNLI